MAHLLQQWCKLPAYGQRQPGTVRAVEKLDHVYHRDRESVSAMLVLNNLLCMAQSPDGLQHFWFETHRHCRGSAHWLDLSAWVTGAGT